jgi:serine/threonine protein kinase/dipeptidyl aminopeptidase/acylaminoacyl peptidase
MDPRGDGRPRSEETSSPHADTVRAPGSGGGSGVRSSTPPATLGEGARIGRYTLGPKLGSGAMGEVYAAYDPDLDRKVALKLVRTGEGSTGSASTRGRVLREAKAIARLAHPNAVAVYDVGTFGADEVFIAMELVEGGTLRDYMARDDRSWRETLGLLVQAGDGLAAAHAAGLVHRDFKPDNVLLGADGRPRVADFGLARASAAADPTPVSASSATSAARAGAAAMAETMTQEGTILGTPAYMAPEQMRGEPADARSDLFSFCVVAYEALWGRRPFEGDGFQELKTRVESGAIVAPPATSDVPRWVYDAVARGLRPRPEDRPPDMPALLAALRAEPQAERSSLRPTLLLAGLGVVLLGASVTLFRGAHSRSASPTAARQVPTAPAAPRLEPAGFRRITFGEGCEEFPSFTPDGRAVVYDGSEGPYSAIFLLTLADLSQRQLTHVEGWDFAPAVSPDGRRVAFLRSAGPQGGTFVVPIDATPATPPRFLTRGNLRPSWSPDGTALWAGKHDHFTRISAEDGHVERTLDVPAGYIGGQSIERPDGRLVVTFPFIAEAAAGAVGVYAPDGTLKKLLEGNVGEVLAWMPGPGERVSIARKMDNNVSQLTAVPLDGSPATSLGSSGVQPRKGLVYSPDGKRVVYSTCRGNTAIAKVSADGKVTPLAAASEWEDTDVAAIGGTSSLLVVSERSGHPQLWVVDRDSSAAPPRLAASVDPVTDVAVSADGRLAAASLTPDGVWLVDLGGAAAPKKLSADPTDQTPAFDAHGAEVLFTREGADKMPVVMHVAVSGGEARPLLERGSRDAAVLPDGRVLYLRGEADKALVPTIYDPRSGARAPLSRQLAAGSYARPQASADGAKVVVIQNGTHLVEVDVASGKVLRSLDHEGDQFARAVYSGSDLIVARTAWIGDLWLADLQAE